MSGGVGDRGRGLELVKRSEKGVKSSQVASPLQSSSYHRVIESFSESLVRYSYSATCSEERQEVRRLIGALVIVLHL